MKPSVLLVGKVNAPRFHRARALVQSLGANLNATVKSMLPIDYERHVEILQKDLGGVAWGHSANVMVMVDGAYLGDDEALIAWVRTQKLSIAALNSDGSGVSWESTAETAYATYLATSGHQYAFLDLAVDGQNVGRMLFELYAAKLPKTCENFLRLCTGGSVAPSTGLPLHYMGTPIHRIVPGGWIQGGDVVSGTGAGGASVLGDTIPDESFCIPHDMPGVLGMATSAAGPHTGASQFYVTLAEMPSFDCKSVAFGRLIDGGKVLHFVGSLETSMGRPKGAVSVCSCGKLAAVNLGSYDQQAAAVRLQAVQRSRLARKEAEDKAKAAEKLQAVSKGRKARKEANDQQAAAVRVQAVSKGRAARKEAKKKRGQPVD